MTAAVAVGLAGVAALTIAVLALVRARHRQAARSARHADALEGLAVAMARAAEDLEDAVRRVDLRPHVTVEVPRAPAATIDPATGLPGRAAFVDALRAVVADAHRDDRRVALALITVDVDGAQLDDQVRRVAAAALTVGPGVYRVGEHAVAIVLPDDGRAAALAAIARVEATLDGAPRVLGRAGELAHGEDPIAFLARVAEVAGGDPPPRIPTRRSI